MSKRNNPIKILKNPKTSAYLKFKKFILSSNFNWHYSPHIYSQKSDLLFLNHPSEKIRDFDYVDHSFFSHMFLERPLPHRKYPLANSKYLKLVEEIICEVLQYNKISMNYFFRINANLVLPMKGRKKTIPHVDLTWNHNILLIYFTDAGGETVCVDDNLKKQGSFDPPEDGVMLFKATNQLHYHCLPEKKRRIILIANYI